MSLSLGLGLGLTMQHYATTDALLSLFKPAGRNGILIDNLAKQAYRDTALTTLVSADGQAVAGLKDRSGKGNNGTQATTASQATYKTGTPPDLSFDGGDSYAFPSDAGKLTGDFAVYHVVTVPSGTQEIITKSDTSSSSSSPKCWTLDFSNMTPRFLFRSVENSNTPGSGYGFITGSALTAGSTHVIGAERNGSTITLRVDGTSVGTPLTGVTGTLGDFDAEMQIGRFWFSSSFGLYYTGKFYRLLLLNGASLTDDQRAMVVSNLGAGLL